MIGGKWLMGVGVLVTALFTLLTPLAANTNIYFLYVVRIIEGLGEGQPDINSLLIYNALFRSDIPSHLRHDISVGGSSGEKQVRF